MRLREVESRIRQILRENELCRDEYHQWAVSVMPEYQALLVDMGFVDLAVVGEFPNDHWIDGIAIRDALGHEVTVPDPGDVKREGDDPAPVVDFFAKLRAAPRRQVQVVDVSRVNGVAEQSS